MRRGCLSRTCRWVASPWACPPEQRATLKRGKVVLKEALARYVPAATVERRKAGFGIPLTLWLNSERGQERRRALGGPDSALAGFLDPAKLRPLLGDPHDGPQADVLWSLLALEVWAEIFLSKPAVLAAPPGGASVS